MPPAPMPPVPTSRSYRCAPRSVALVAAHHREESTADASIVQLHIRVWPELGEHELAILLGFLMFTLIYFMVAVIVAGYVPELFPTAVRMRGNGICGTVGRLTTIFVPFGVVALFKEGGVASVVLGISGALVVQALLAWTYKTETNGRSLEAIAVEDSGGHAAIEKLT